MRVALLVTGRTEYGGLPAAMRGLFPGHDFYALPTPDEIASNPDRFPYDGFTSIELQPKHVGAPPETARELVERAAQAALRDRKLAAADLVFIIDDLEVANASWPDRAVDVFRQAVHDHLSDLPVGARAKTATALRDKVSLHLAKPMIEAWFFGDPQALTRAGMPASASPLLASADVESFATSDPGYAAATATSCPTWAASSKKKNRPKWLGSASRTAHPKGYLQWLCIDGSSRCCTTYAETAGLGQPSGANALANISWAILLSSPLPTLRFVRAFLTDVATGLQQPPSIGGPAISEDPQLLPVTSLVYKRTAPVLRNI